MNLNSGINPELILLHFGSAFCSGKNQPLKKVIKIYKKRFLIYVYYIMDKFSKLLEYQLLEIQDNLKTIFMIQKIIHFGPAFCSGKNQPLKKVIKIYKKRFLI